MRTNLLTLTLLLLVSLGGCDCEDHVLGWDLNEELPESDDFTPPDPHTIVINAPDWRPDDPEQPEPPDPADRGWVTDEVVSSVPRDHALNERTSLTVDDAGTIWIGFHSCSDDFCLDPVLSLARKARGGTWTFEAITEQTGTFGIEVAATDQPIAVYLNPINFTFEAAKRVATNSFEFHEFDVVRGDVSDGLDIGVDGERVFVTFSSNANDPVRLFIHGQDRWSSLAQLPIQNGRAARERGLQADGRGNLYLVHRNLASDWGVAKYELSTGTWTERTYFDGLFTLDPSSMIVTDEGEICISGTIYDSHMGLSCGVSGQLDIETYALANQLVDPYTYSSMVEGTDGTLYIAYNTLERDLRLARKSPAGEWEFETVFVGETYGVSTAIDRDDLLVISYYTCDDRGCRLESLSRPQDIP